MTKKRWILNLLMTVCYILTANVWLLTKNRPWMWAVAGLLFLLVNILSGIAGTAKIRWRLRFLAQGIDCLLVFICTVLVSCVWQGIAWFAVAGTPSDILWNLLICVCTNAVLFWNGMITLYVTSVQLGIRYRVIGALCGMIPLVNLVVLGKLLQIVIAEFDVELEKERLNALRVQEKVCCTKYPILLVHGVFFRDNAVFNYWGRIPAELEKNGARVFYGKHSSALPIRESAKEIAWRVREIVARTGCEKVNIIAHSKGGLDCRCAMHEEGIAPLVASLTTINTPHRGCGFADYLLDKLPASFQEKVASTYNKAAHALGDEEPDFLAAVRDLTASACMVTDQKWSEPPGVLCQSVGSVLERAVHGRFPLKMTGAFVAYFDGKNDGLVAEDSFAYGSKYTLLKTRGKRGISHADIIDLNKENIAHFDVREFYVQLVHDLKDKGL